MEWSDHTGIRTAAAVLLVSLALGGCESSDPADATPGDLPAAALEVLEEPGVVDRQLLPREHDLNGVAVSRTGDFAVTAEMEGDEVTSEMAILSWDDEMGRWSTPEPLAFSEEGFADGEPTISPDDSYILFHSARPSEQPAAADMNIWVAQRDDGPEGEIGWTDPWLVPGIFSPAWDGAPSLQGDASLFFASLRDGPETGLNLFVAPFEQGTWMAPQKLPQPLNSSADDTDPFVAPDGSFIVFSSNRDGLFDVYVVFARGEGWGEPMPLNETVNDPAANDRSPYLSSAGSTLFWVRDGELMAAPADDTGLAEMQEEFAPDDDDAEGTSGSGDG